MLLHSGVYQDNQFRKDLQTDPRVGVIAGGTRLISYKLNLKIGQMDGWTTPWLWILRFAGKRTNHLQPDRLHWSLQVELLRLDWVEDVIILFRFKGVCSFKWMCVSSFVRAQRSCGRRLHSLVRFVTDRQVVSKLVCLRRRTVSCLLIRLLTPAPTCVWSYQAVAIELTEMSMKICYFLGVVGV